MSKIDDVLELEQEFYKTRQKVKDQILTAENGVDNNILKKIYDDAIEKGNKELARELHTAMYDNRASQRIKQAERVSSSLGEHFDRVPFEDKIKSEKDMVEKPNEVRKSIAFENSPHFAVGMRPTDIADNPEIKEDYLNRVNILKKEMEYQLTFANNRESHLERTLEQAKKYFGEDLYQRYKNENIVQESLNEVDENFREVRQQVSEKIFNAESNYDQNVLMQVYQKTLKHGDTALSADLHYSIYENSALQRIKQAERVANTLGESFDRTPFENKIKAEGGVIEKVNETEKSSIFKNSQHFSVGMRSVFHDKKSENDYKLKVKQITNELEHQLSFVEQRENRLVQVLDRVSKIFGEDLYKKFSGIENISKKISNFINQETKKDKSSKLDGLNLSEDERSQLKGTNFKIGIADKFKNFGSNNDIEEKPKQTSTNKPKI